MTKTITYEYGVNLENDWNQLVTKSWDTAQQKVHLALLACLFIAHWRFSHHRHHHRGEVVWSEVL